MVLKVVGFGALSAVTAFVLSESGFKGKRAYSALAVCLLLLYFIDSFGSAVSTLSSLSITAEGQEALGSSLKILGASYAFSLGAAVSEELSEKGIAEALTLVCQAEILLIALPYIIDVLDLAKTIFNSI